MLLNNFHSSWKLAYHFHAIFSTQSVLILYKLNLFQLLLLTTLLIVYVRQKKRAIQHVNELNNRLNMLKNMETEFEDVQRKWKEERNNRFSTLLRQTHKKIQAKPSRESALPRSKA